MKIMVISPTSIFPPVHGGQSRTYYFCKHLAQSHDVLLVSPPARVGRAECTLPVAFFEINRRGRLPQFFDPVFVSRATQLITQERPDVIQAECVWPGFHALLLRALTGVPFVINEFNAEFARRRRMGSAIWPLLWLYEAALCRRANFVFCVSEQDRQTIIDLGARPDRTQVVANGVDTDTFFPSTSTPSYDRLSLDRRPTVLFFGALEYLPNRQAVDIIARELLPRVASSVPTVRFVIAGRNPPASQLSQNILFVGAVDRIQDFINAADVSICPQRIGGGTRLKIIESLACGKPVVSTSIGAEGLLSEAVEQGLTVADDWGSFASALVGLLKNPTRVEVTDTFLETYSWRRIVERCPYNSGILWDDGIRGRRKPVASTYEGRN
ncbi:MAG: glycosyltransferase family 4 protein [Chloroflexi bacterium]|nr:glycosyltransferase family 4 protein [Chloroflexota bacterium]